MYYIAGGNKVNKPGVGGARVAQPRTGGARVPAKAPAHSFGTGAKKVVPANNSASNEQLKQVQNEMQELKVNMDTVEKERDFYFGKLRDIEMLLQAMQEKEQAEVSEKVMQILYASEEEKVEIDEAGNLSIVPIAGEANEEE